jgi:hypothetical protein
MNEMITISLSEYSEYKHRQEEIPKEHRAYYKICLCCGTENRGVYQKPVNGYRLEEMSKKAKATYEEIRKRIASSEAVGADETRCRVNGHKHLFHVCTKTGTFIVSFAGRGHKAADRFARIRSRYCYQKWAACFGALDVSPNVEYTSSYK